MNTVFVYWSILFSLVIKFSLITVSANPTGKECESNININGTKKSLSEEITEILNNMKKNYDKRVRPYYGEKAVSVGVTMFLLNVFSVSEVEMDFTVDFYFRQMWKDPRLKFDENKGIQNISVDLEFAKGLWAPDTVFANEKKSYFHEATSHSEYFMIFADGNILRSTRLTVTATCPMDLSYFPMDGQLCSLDMESYGFSTSDVNYYWANGRNSIAVSTQLPPIPQFKFLGHKQQKTEMYVTGRTFSHLVCYFKFARPLGYYLIQIYIPAGLIVVISWISFWLNRNSTSARVAHGVATVLTLLTLMSSVNSTLPKISYVKAMDVYLATCFFMVFGSVLEAAMVGYISETIENRKSEEIAKQRKTASLTKILVGNIVGVDIQNEARKFNKMDVGSNTKVAVDKINTTLDESDKILDNLLSSLQPVRIDKYSRALFPLFFVIFNILYWIIYLHVSNVVEDDLILLDGN